MSASGILAYLANQTQYYNQQLGEEQERRAVENAIRIQKVQADFARGQEALQNSIVREKAARDESGSYSEAKLQEQRTGEIAPTGDSYSDTRLREQLGLPPVGKKPDKPLENLLGSVDSQESYRTAMMQYLAAGGRKPKWYTGNYENDQGNIAAAIGATMTPLQQMQRAEAVQRNKDLEEARVERGKLAREREERLSREAALKREGMATKPAIPKRDERIQALNVLGGVLGEGFDQMSQREQDAVATRAASIAKQNAMSEDGKGVDFESLLQDAYNDMIAKGELKLPQEGTGLRGFLGFGQESKPAGFSPKGTTPQGQAPQGPSTQKAQAPAAAIEYLKAHPELRDAFKKKYGYLPE